MARPPSITDEEILAAARAVFLDKGITATVDEVAARCGVGEATVFRRFPTKQSLFLAAMDTASEPIGLEVLLDRGDSPDVRGTLLALGREMLAVGRKMIPLAMMKMSNPGMEAQPARSARLARTMSLLTDYFRAQIEAGRINAKDPRVAARIWLGSVQHLVFFEYFTRTPDTITPEAYFEGLVDLFCPPPQKSRKS
jgi:AcrR family transcriptional regulator